MKKRLRKVLSVALALFTIIGAMPVASLLAPVEVDATETVGTFTYSITADDELSFGGGNCNLNVELFNLGSRVQLNNFGHAQVTDDKKSDNGGTNNPPTYDTFKVQFQGGASIKTASVKINETEKMDDTLKAQMQGENWLSFEASQTDTVQITVELEANNGGGGDSGEGGQPNTPHADAVIRLNGMGGTLGDFWHGVPMVNDYGLDPDAAGDFYYSETWKGVPEGDHRRGGARVGIVAKTETSNWTDCRDYVDYEHYPNGTQERNLIVDNANPGDGKRLIVIATQWSETIDKVWVNGVEYSDQLITANTPMDKYFAHFEGQQIFSEIEVNAAQPDPNNGNKEVYEVSVALRPLSPEECRVGNFRWSSDEKLKGSDTYVGNAIMELQSITYNGETYEDIENCKWVGDYSPNHEDFGTGAMMGDMFVPAGAEVTMKITPQKGYQVQSFKLSSGQFKAEKEAGVFTFTVGKGNFHLGGTTIAVEDEAVLDTDKIAGADVALTDSAIAGGSGMLTVFGATPAEAKTTAFEAQAKAADLEIDQKAGGYLDINLDQIIYIANSEDNATAENSFWAQEVHKLPDGQYAEVTLTFGEDVDVAYVRLVHNIGDGDEFETLTPISYDQKAHTATFKVNSFSTFAIAKAHTAATPVTPSNTNTNTNTNTNNGSSSSSAPAAAAAEVAVPKTAESFPMGLLIILSVVSLGTMATVVVKRRKM